MTRPAVTPEQAARARQRRTGVEQSDFELDRLQERAAFQGFSHKITEPFYVAVESEFDYDHDGLIKVEIGPVKLAIPFDAAEALIYKLLCELHGEAQAAALMALIQRMPYTDVDSESFGADSRGAIRALWEAAWHFRHAWPQRNAGFDDRLWGVTPPPAVTERFELGTPYRVPAQASPEFDRFRDPVTDPDFTDQGTERWKPKGGLGKKARSER